MKAITMQGFMHNIGQFNKKIFYFFAQTIRIYFIFLLYNRIFGAYMPFVQGQLLYNPTRPLLKREDQSCTLILDLPKDDLASYYQWFLKQKYGQWLKLQSPMFGTHVTVVRPQEVNTSHPLWLAYEGQLVTIEYGFVERHWEFWSLNVYSKELVNIRYELGLRTDFRLHITIGRQFDWQPRLNQPGVVHDTDYPIIF